MVVLGAVSIFEFIAAVVTCSQQQTCGGLNAYAVATGCVSLAVCLLLAYFRDRGEASPMALFLLVWWVAACFFLTFISPFTDFANGFAACWIAVIVSMNLYRTINTNFADAISRASRDAGAVRRSRAEHSQPSTLSSPAACTPQLRILPSGTDSV